MMVSLGGIDKLGHMWGPEDVGYENGVDVDNTPGTPGEMRHLPFIARTADEQVGRLVDALDDNEMLDETLIVITADHAGQTGVQQNGDDEHFHGELAPDQTNPRCDAPSTGIRSDRNWYFGSDLDEIYLDPSDAVAGLRDRLAGNLAMSYQDGHVARGCTTTRTPRSARRHSPCSTCRT